MGLLEIIGFSCAGFFVLVVSYLIAIVFFPVLKAPKQELPRGSSLEDTGPPPIRRHETFEVDGTTMPQFAMPMRGSRTRDVRTSVAPAPACLPRFPRASMPRRRKMASRDRCLTK